MTPACRCPNPRNEHLERISHLARCPWFRALWERKAAPAA